MRVVGAEVPEIIAEIDRNWPQMRLAVIAAMEGAPGGVPSWSRAAMSFAVQEGPDAVESLGLAGFQVTVEMVERLGAGDWNPFNSLTDKMSPAWLALVDYLDARQSVVSALEQTVKRGRDAAQVLTANYLTWQTASVAMTAALPCFKGDAVRGYRLVRHFEDDEVDPSSRLPSGVPMDYTAVRACMQHLFKRIEKEAHPLVRAVLVHYYIWRLHPHVTGNGRIARLMMNFMLAAGGYAWVVIPRNAQPEYLSALRVARDLEDISHLARMLLLLLKQQTPADVPAASHKEKPPANWRS